MSDYFETKIIDNCNEHKFHNNYDPKCSICYRNVKEFDVSGSEEDLEEVNEDVRQMFNIDLERIYNSGRP